MSALFVVNMVMDVLFVVAAAPLFFLFSFFFLGRGGGVEGMGACTQAGFTIDLLPRRSPYAY